MDLVWTELPLSLIVSLAEHNDIRAGQIRRQETIAPIVVRFAETLLSYGGCRVVFRFEQTDYAALLEVGTLLAPTYIELRRGQQSECHRNTARRWRRAKRTTSIVTGFALTAEDGRWRSHTWLIHSDGHIIETTEERDRYYGIVLTKPQAEQFVINELS